jgi:hypothetical protein
VLSVHSFEDGLRIVKTRGEAMQAASDASPSGMASIIGLDSEKVAKLCEAASEAVGEGEGVRIANYLCPVRTSLVSCRCFRPLCGKFVLLAKCLCLVCYSPTTKQCTGSRVLQSFFRRAKERACGLPTICAL